MNGRAGTTKQVISVNVGDFVCSLLCSAELVFQITGRVICIPLGKIKYYLLVKDSYPVAVAVTGTQVISCHGHVQNLTQMQCNRGCIQHNYQPKT